LSATVTILRAPEVRRRVLIIDDNIDGARMLATLVRTLGHEADYCINGYSALELANKVRPHLVLVDLALPDISGWAVARALRNTPGLEQIRIIAMTGHYGANERQRSIDAGCEDHLVKPIDPAVVIALLGEAATREQKHA
jgi:CheY-like chemotaxis protein